MLMDHEEAKVGGDLGPRGATLMFRDVSYSVRVGSEERVILQGISGIVEPGQCCAILGSSGMGATLALGFLFSRRSAPFLGSGKTSLLDILAGQNEDRGVQGAVMLNNIAAAPRFIQEHTGYVMQDDRLLSFLTVRETLLFSAKLRLSAALSTAEKEAEVDKVIGLLGLRNVTQNKIGGTFRRGLSGGEKRRVSIALQLLGEPSASLIAFI